MSGGEPGGPVERDEAVETEAAAVTRPESGSEIRLESGTEIGSETTAEITAEVAAGDETPAGEDPWPELAALTGEVHLPEDKAAPGGDRRVAPEPPPAAAIPVAVAAAAPRPRPAGPAESAHETPAPPSAPPPAPPPASPPAAPPTGMRPGPATGTAAGTVTPGESRTLDANAPSERSQRGSGIRRPKVLIGLVAGLSVVVVGALAAMLLSGGGAGSSTAAAPTTSAAPSGRSSEAPGTGTAPATPGARGAPATPGSPPSGAVRTPAAPGPATSAPPEASDGAPAVPGPAGGPVVRYQVVQQDPGYFESVLTFTNRTGAPMHAWEVSFTHPGANVKNIWDAVLVRSGDHPVIRSMRTADAIPPGGTLEVRFGAEGSPSAPADCLFGGRPCDFA